MPFKYNPAYIHYSRFENQINKNSSLKNYSSLLFYWLNILCKPSKSVDRL